MLPERSVKRKVRSFMATCSPGRGFSSSNRILKVSVLMTSIAGMNLSWGFFLGVPARSGWTLNATSTLWSRAGFRLALHPAHCIWCCMSVSFSSVELPLHVSQCIT